MGGPWFKASLGKMLADLSEKTSWAMVVQVIIPATCEAEVGGAWSEPGLGQQRDPTLKHKPKHKG